MSGIKGMRWKRGRRRPDLIGKAGHEGTSYAVLADAYGITTAAVAKNVERYRRAKGIETPPLTWTRGI